MGGGIAEEFQGLQGGGDHEQGGNDDDEADEFRQTVHPMKEEVQGFHEDGRE